MNTLEKIENQKYIDTEDVKNIKFIVPILLSQKLLRLLEKISIQIGIKPNELKNLAFQKKDNNDNLDNKEEDKTDIKTVLLECFKLFIYNAYDEQDQPNSLLSEMIELLAKITKVEKEFILNSDIEVIFELLMRTHFKYRNEVNKSFFTSAAVDTVMMFLNNNILSLLGINKEN